MLESAEALMALDPPPGEEWAAFDEAWDETMGLYIAGFEAFRVGLVDLDVDSLEDAIDFFEQAVASLEAMPEVPDTSCGDE